MHMGFETEVTKYCTLCHATEKVKLFISLNELWFDNDTTFSADVEDEGGHDLPLECIKCGSTHTILLDPKIGGVIARLNEKGYHTIYSCDGFVSEDQYDIPYISFDAKTTPSDIFNSLPDKWAVENDADFNRVVNNGNCRTVSIYYNAHAEEDDSIDWNLDAMLYWVDSLPYNDMEENMIIKMPGERYMLNDIKQAFENNRHQVSEVKAFQPKGKWMVLVKFLNKMPSIALRDATCIDDYTMVIPIDDIRTDSIYQLVISINTACRWR